MKISTNWLKDYVDLSNTDLNDLAIKVTNAGVNVEGISSEINSEYFRVGEIVKCTNHPDSDHLHICFVNIETETLQIVCGAKNAREGIKVIVSLIGAVLPGEFEIKKSVIRGVESFGMLCALSELGLNDQIDGIHELPASAVIGSNPFEYINISNDTIYTLDLNPNRNDCLSHLGFAHEVASVLDTKVKTPDISHEENDISIKDNLDLLINTDNVKLFLLKRINDIKIKESPKFIQDRLLSCGMRPINNIVDISNYIMLEYGQPMHFYDADKLGKTLEVRMALSDETVETLDKKVRNLTTEDIVITNGKNTLGIAGVMGGYSTEVDETTKNIIIESAIFEPIHIRRTSIRLDLRSEASLRSEKELNYEYTYESIDRACNLLEEYADGQVCKDILSFDKIDKTPKKAHVTIENINKVLGINLSEEDVKDSFDRLGFKYSGNYDVVIPNRRMDVSIKEDLIEEVGRMYGFHKITGTNPLQELKKGKYAPRIKYRKDISNRLRSLGLDEVRTYTLSKENVINKYNYEEKALINLDKPISNDRTNVRVSLIPSLIEVMDYNISRGVEDINIYEISNTYYKENNEFKESMKLSILLNGIFLENSWNKTIVKNDFYVLKGIVENIIHYLGLDKRVVCDNDKMISILHPGISASIKIDNEIVGYFGKINPSINKKDVYVCEMDLDKLINKKSGKLKFTELNKYPCVLRDMAFIVDKNVKSGDIVKEIINTNKSLITECIVFDEYIMNDKKSLAYALKFESFTHTLTEDEVNGLFTNIIDNVCKKFNAILRDK